jgi:hypothetical protein
MNGDELHQRIKLIIDEEGNVTDFMRRTLRNQRIMIWMLAACALFAGADLAARLLHMV